MSDPALIRDPILEAASRALDNCIDGYQAEAVLAAVTPLIRAQVLEEAAQVAEKLTVLAPTAKDHADHIAARIRALAQKDQTP